MAFTKTPSTDTYSSQRIKLAREINTRPNVYTTKDEDFLNCYIDVVKTKVIEDKRLFVTKRPGTGTFLASVQTNPVRGMYYWADRRKILYAVDNDVYVYALSTGINTQLSAAFGTTSGDVGFCEYLYDTGVSVIVATDGTTLITIDNSNTVVTCADADLPAPHIPTPVFLDGYLFLAKENTGDVYNSDLNDPMLWTPGNLINAEIEGDFVVRLCKMNNYLIAMGKNTIEYFWDAANESGSPLQRNDSVVKHVGYYGGYAEIGKNIYFIGTDTQGQLDVYQLEDLKINQVGTPVISRYLNNSGSSFGLARGNIISISGKNFYVLYSGTYTYVLDIENKIWERWAFQDRTDFPLMYSVNAKKVSEYLPVCYLESSNSKLYYFSDTLSTDDATNYTYRVVTASSDFDTINRKTMARLSILGDSPPSDASILVQWSDDDYKTFNTGISVNLNQDLPSVTRLGSFRQRAFKLTYTGDQPIRLQELEVDINKGNS